MSNMSTGFKNTKTTHHSSKPKISQLYNSVQLTLSYLSLLWLVDHRESQTRSQRVLKVAPDSESSEKLDGFIKHVEKPSLDSNSASTWPLISVAAANFWDFKTALHHRCIFLNYRLQRSRLTTSHRGLKPSDSDVTEEKVSRLLLSLKLKVGWVATSFDTAAVVFPSRRFVVNILWRLCNEKAAACSSSHPHGRREEVVCSFFPQWKHLFYVTRRPWSPVKRRASDEWRARGKRFEFHMTTDSLTQSHS